MVVDVFVLFILQNVLNTKFRVQMLDAIYAIHKMLRLWTYSMLQVL